MKRRILHKLKLTEISAVDRPCQEHAKAVIMKRVSDGTDPAGGSSGDPANKGDNLMAGDKDVEKVTELTGQVAELETQVEELSKQLEAAVGSNPELAGLQELMTKTEELTVALETAVAERDELNKLLEIEKAMSPDEKDHCSDMEPDAKAAFMAKSPEDRKSAMSKKAEGEEKVTIEGRTIKKSAVGEDTFEILKAQAARITKSEEEIKKANDARELAELTKRADADYSHVPGTTEERAKMLREIGKMEEPVRKAFEAVFTQSEKLAKGAFVTVGHKDTTGKDNTTPDMKKAIQDFSAKVSEIKKRDDCSKTDAMSTARREFPELYKASQTAEAAGN